MLMAQVKGGMILCEFAEGNLASTATEGLGIGRKLAGDLEQELSTVTIGSQVGECAQEAICFEVVGD